MAKNDINDIIEITEETKAELRDFNEEEAYFELCQIFAYAQSSGNYAQFQSDLAEWKKRYPVDLFSDEFKSKIKYMLSNEFLDKVLKNFLAFDELSKKDPSKGLEKLRKILDRAEKHKDRQKLDKDLEELYSEYPLKFLKEKYPHVVRLLLSKTHIDSILEKFDSSSAFRELENITNNPQKYKDADDYKDAIGEWQRLYPTADFNDKYKPQVESTLSKSLDDKTLAGLFPEPLELDLTQGEVIPTYNISVIEKDCLVDFFNIVNTDSSNYNALFDWSCKYGRYINSFNENTKGTIINNLMRRYGNEFSHSGSNFRIPKMEYNNLLSLDEYNSISDTKKDSVVQMLAIMYSGNDITNDDIYNLNIINENSHKAEIIEDSHISQTLDKFIKEVPEEDLTPNDEIYLAPVSNTNVEVSIDDNIDLNLQSTKDDNVELVEEKVHEDTPKSSKKSQKFKDTLKVSVPLERVESNNNSGSSDTGGNSGGSSLSIAPTLDTESQGLESDLENDLENEEDSTKDEIEDGFTRDF